MRLAIQQNNGVGLQLKKLAIPVFALPVVLLGQLEFGDVQRRSQQATFAANKHRLGRPQNLPDLTQGSADGQFHVAQGTRCIDLFNHAGPLGGVGPHADFQCRAPHHFVAGPLHHLQKLFIHIQVTAFAHRGKRRWAWGWIEKFLKIFPRLRAAPFLSFCGR